MKSGLVILVLGLVALNAWLYFGEIGSSLTVHFTQPMPLPRVAPLEINKSAADSMASDALEGTGVGLQVMRDEGLLSVDDVTRANEGLRGVERVSEQISGDEAGCSLWRLVSKKEDLKRDLLDFEHKKTPYFVSERVVYKEPYRWLLVPPGAVQGRAAHQVADMRRRGIDSFVITEGDYRGGISLGLYGARRAAEAEYARIKALVPEVVMGEKPKSSKMYALFIAKSEAAGSVSAGDIEEMSEGEKKSCQLLRKQDKRHIMPASRNGE